MIKGPAARRVKSGCRFYQPRLPLPRGQGGRRAAPTPAAAPHSRSKMPAAPMPVPMHMLTIP